MLNKSDVKLICPSCAGDLGTLGHMKSKCPNCGFIVDKIQGVPVLRSKGQNENLDLTSEANTLPVINSGTLKIPFLENALKSGKFVLELGAGVDICDIQNLIKSDANIYSSNLDLCADAHKLPFEDNSFDFCYSLATFEHIHSPWIVADEIYRVLKPGGQVYTLCAFNQHVHGYPSHYFNMTDMGLRRIFQNFSDVVTEPSRYCPLDQIAYSLMDLAEMSIALRKNEPNSEAIKLEAAINEVVRILPDLGPKLMACADAKIAWSRIAPGFDCIATKPL